MIGLAFQMDNARVTAITATGRDDVSPQPLHADTPTMPCVAVATQTGDFLVGAAAEWQNQQLPDVIWGLVDGAGEPTAALPPILTELTHAPNAPAERMVVATYPLDWPAAAQDAVDFAISSAGFDCKWKVDLSLATVIDWLRKYEAFGGVVAVVRVGPRETNIDLVEVSSQLKIQTRLSLPVGHLSFANALVDACMSTLRATTPEVTGDDEPGTRQALYNVLAEQLRTLQPGGSLSLSIELPATRWNGILPYEHAVACTRGQAVQVTRGVLSALKGIGRSWDDLGAVLISHPDWAVGLTQFLAEYTGEMHRVDDQAAARGALYAAYASSLHLAIAPSEPAATALALPLARIRPRTAPAAKPMCLGTFYFEDEPTHIHTSPFVIGRRSGVDLLLPSDRHPVVSGEHCRIEADEWSCIVIDTSRNGTFVNGEPVESAALRPGDLVTLGLSGPVLEFDRPSVDWHTRRQAIRLVCAERSWPVLRVTAIGRYPDCQVHVNWGQFPGVSGLHCEVQHDLTSMRIYDRSRNGTYVNGKAVEGSCELRPGDVIMLGPKGPQLTLVFEAAKTATHMPAIPASVGLDLR